MRSVVAFASVSALLFSAIACSSKDPDSGFEDGSSSGADKDLTSTDGTSSSSGSFSSGGSTSSTSSSSGGAQCAGVKAEVAKPKVDLIFVIDDSGSMDGEMVQIKQNVNTFASKVGKLNLDYTVLFIVKRAATPTSAGNVICVPAPLGGANCADNPPLFHHINQDVQSTNSLALILSTYDSANAALKWSDKVRPEAMKVFIEVTDDKSAMTADAFETALFAKQPAGMFGTAAKRNYVFHSIISKPVGTASAPPNFSTAKCATAAGTSIDYQDLSIRTGGIMDEVCKTDYSGVLDNIAKGIGEKLGCEMGYPNGAGADPDKVVVNFTPGTNPTQTLTQVTDESKCAANGTAWYYDNNAAPTKIILCKTFCTTLQATPDAKIEAIVGCKGKTPS